MVVRTGWSRNPTRSATLRSAWDVALHHAAPHGPPLREMVGERPAREDRRGPRVRQAALAAASGAVRAANDLSIQVAIYALMVSGIFVMPALPQVLHLLRSPDPADDVPV